MLPTIACRQRLCGQARRVHAVRIMKSLGCVNPRIQTDAPGRGRAAHAPSNVQLCPARDVLVGSSFAASVIAVIQPSFPLRTDRCRTHPSEARESTRSNALAIGGRGWGGRGHSISFPRARLQAWPRPGYLVGVASGVPATGLATGVAALGLAAGVAGKIVCPCRPPESRGGTRLVGRKLGVRRALVVCAKP